MLETIWQRQRALGDSNDGNCIKCKEFQLLSDVCDFSVKIGKNKVDIKPGASSPEAKQF
jgi:hypothetical protein